MTYACCASCEQQRVRNVCHIYRLCRVCVVHQFGTNMHAALYNVKMTCVLCACCASYALDLTCACCVSCRHEHAYRITCHDLIWSVRVQLLIWSVRVQCLIGTLRTKLYTTNIQYSVCHVRVVRLIGTTRTALYNMSTTCLPCACSASYWPYTHLVVEHKHTVYAMCVLCVLSAPHVPLCITWIRRVPAQRLVGTTRTTLYSLNTQCMPHAWCTSY